MNVRVAWVLECYHNLFESQNPLLLISNHGKKWNTFYRVKYHLYPINHLIPLMVSKWSLQATGAADMNAFTSFQQKWIPCLTWGLIGENVIMLLCPWIAPIHHSSIQHRDFILWIKHEAYLSWLRDWKEKWKKDSTILFWDSYQLT